MLSLLFNLICQLSTDIKLSNDFHSWNGSENSFYASSKLSQYVDYFWFCWNFLQSGWNATRLQKSSGEWNHRAPGRMEHACIIWMHQSSLCNQCFCINLFRISRHVLLVSSLPAFFHDELLLSYWRCNAVRNWQSFLSLRTLSMLCSCHVVCFQLKKIYVNEF